MIWYVELQNTTDRRDDEALRVDAPNRARALEAARICSGNRFTVGQVVRARCTRESDRRYLQHLRAMTTRSVKWGKYGLVQMPKRRK